MALPRLQPAPTDLLGHGFATRPLRGGASPRATVFGWLRVLGLAFGLPWASFAAGLAFGLPGSWVMRVSGLRLSSLAATGVGGDQPPGAADVKRAMRSRHVQRSAARDEAEAMAKPP